MFYQELVFVHVLAALAFFMAHGASAAMAFRLRQEKELSRIRAILDLSQAAVPFAYMSLLVLLLAGIIAGVMGNWFAQGWIWLALVLLVVLTAGMIFYATRFYTPIRKAVGLPYRDGKNEYPEHEPESEAEIAAAIARANPLMLFSFSFAMITLILWLMMYKPF